MTPTTPRGIEIPAAFWEPLAVSRAHMQLENSGAWR